MQKQFSRSAALGLATVLVSTLSASSHAVWTYSSVIDTTAAAPSGSFTSFGSVIQMSNGVVVGTANYGANNMVYRGVGGGTYQSVAKAGDAAPSGTFASFGSPGIGGSTISYRGVYGATTSLFVDNGGTRTTIISTGDAAPVGTFTNFGNPRNSGNTVVFNGTFNGGNDTGIFVKNGGTLTTLNKTGDTGPGGGVFSGFGLPVISGSNVAYQGFTATSRANYFWNGSRQTIVTVGDAAVGLTGNFTDVLQPALSGSTAAFLGLTSTSRGIYRWEAGALTLLAKVGDPASTGTFTDFSSNVSISGNIVAYTGTFNGTNRAVMLHNGSFASEVIKTGDSLFGSTVTALGTTGFIDQNQAVAFTYTLADGRLGVAVAVPEPGTMLALGLGGLALIRSRKARKN